MMNPKAIFLDLDGTLLDDAKQITADNRAAIGQALEQGHKVVIATGRPLVSAILQAQALELTAPGCYLIAYNGSVIYDMGAHRSIFQRTLPLEIVREVFAEANRLGIHIQTYDEQRVLVEPRCDDAAVRRYCDSIRMSYAILPDVHQLTREPVKALLIDYEHPDRLEHFREWLLTRFAGRLDSFFSCPYYLEVVNNGMSKGSALQRLCALLDIPLENSVAVGDAANDLAMIQAAHVGVAMANAIDEVKAASTYITRRDNNHGGVAEVIERFLLA